MGFQKALANIPGLMVAITEEISSKASGMDMEYGS